MWIVCSPIVIYVLYKTIKDYEPYNKRIERMDRQSYSVKSDKWKRDHGEL